MKIGVYVGSFNPVHLGHEKIINELLNKKVLDKVIVVPSLSYWDKKIDVSLEDRINMLKTIENENIIINQTLNTKTYTYEVMEELEKEYDDLYLIIGADNIIDFDKWKNIDKILKHHVIVIGRNNIDIKEYIKRFNSDKFIIINDFDQNISSTKIRELIQNKDYNSLNNLLNNKVINYIKENNLYIGKKYNIGMYGGKFMPFHKGHNYCIEFASQECKLLYVILFYGGADEERILLNNKEEYLSLESRIKRINNIIKNYDNIKFVTIDVSNLRLEDGSEDWDAETPLVRNVVGSELNAVYSSELSYDDYFKRAYPEAIHRVVDYKRIHYPISGSDIRNMKLIKEREKWIV